MARSPKSPRPQVYGQTTADYGPSIRRQAVEVPARVRPDGSVAQEGYTREPTVIVGSWPDPESPDRRQDIAGAISWLPLRFYRSGDLTSAQVVAASRYRDNLDMAAGVTSGGSYGCGESTPPWDRFGATQVQLQASELIYRADIAIGRDNMCVIRAFVGLATLQDVALAVGVNRKRVMVAVCRALDILDAHLSGVKMAA